MNPAQKYVEYLYIRYPGRIPLAAGLTHGFGKVYPFVFEDSEGRSIGCVGLAWNQGHDPDLVQIYHVNAFKPGHGHGKSILQELCDQADVHGVRLTLMAQSRWVEIDDDLPEPPLEDEYLQDWYRKFGFVGASFMTRDFVKAGVNR